MPPRAGMPPRMLLALFLGVALALVGIVGAAGQGSLPARPQSYVADFAGVIPTDIEGQIEQELRDFEARTTVEIAVVTVKELGGDTIEGYAVRLFEEWGIGKKREDNGILLLVSRDDRQVKIEVGYGMEPYLTDGQAGRILDNDIVPPLKSGDYGHAMLNGMQAITKAVVANGYEPGAVRPPPGSISLGPRGFAMIGLAFASLYVMAYMARTKEVVLGALWGAGAGGVLGWLFGGLVATLVVAAIAGVLGLLLDWALSSAYKYQVRTGRPTSWGSTWGGFYGAGRGGWGGGGSGGGRGFGGFGGGRSGGGGAGRRF